MVNWNLIRTVAAPIVAFLVAYNFVRPLLKILLNHIVLTKLSGLRKNLKKFGNWAVVTGATDGIGKAYAQLLAKEGLNIVLVSRSQEKLQDVSKELQDKYKILVRTIAVDFSNVDIYDKIETELKDLDIGCLVNNVGMGMPHPNYFVGDNEFDIDIYCKMLNINCLSMMRMTRIVTAGMLNSGKGGVVINVASSSGLFPTPMLSVYSATKAFAVHFSRSVRAELARQTGSGSGEIHVQTVSPYFVATKLSSIRRSSYFAPSPISFVNEALNLLGVESNTVGCLSHALQHFAISLVPNCISDAIVLRMMDSTRRRAIKKAKAKAKAN